MRKEVEINSVFAETIESLKGKGIILLAGSPPNPMTIGWGTLGYIWGKFIFTVLVRPSRFTYSRMEEANEFTINILPDTYSKQISFCGKVSGRDFDKIAESGFNLEPGIHLMTPFLKESIIHYECRTVSKNDLLPEALDERILDNYYSRGDFHTVYYGEIVGIFREETMKEI